MAQEFKHLFTPLQVGNITIPSRMYIPAHNPFYYPGFEAPNERAINYWRSRAKGGTKLIVTAPHWVFWLSSADFHTAYESDSVIPALKGAVDAIHEHGSKCFFQLFHLGSAADSRASGGGSVWGASPVLRMNPFESAVREIPHEMDKDDIKRAIEAYAEAARRAKEAGYDGAEIFAAFGLLEASFLSKALNRRTDEYGGSPENRMRFLLETIDAVRENVGSDFVLGVRFTADEFTDGGNTLDDTKEIAKRLEATGKIDYLLPCAATFVNYGHTPPMAVPLAAFVYLAAAIKEVVSLPVFCVGRINDPVLAERILADHQADMVGMVRANICDPEMPNKARDGRLAEIRRCIGCNEGCCPKFIMPITCTYNPEVGKERELAITPADNIKKVMVIGGGAAGLETARVAALRGHTVTLYEKENVLAKALSIAAKSPCRESWEEPVRYYTYQMRLLGVNVRLGVTVTPEMVLKENADAVVVATGAVPYVPDIPGADGENVVEMRQVLQDEVEVGQNVVVADYQSHIYGLDTALFLVERGKKVQLLAEDIPAGTRSDPMTLWEIYTRALSKGVSIMHLTKIRKIKGNTVVTYNVLTDFEQEIDGVDTVVFTTDGMAENSLYRSLKGKVRELYQVGQCVSPRKMLDSVYDGALVGRKL